MFCDPTTPTTTITIRTHNQVVVVAFMEIPIRVDPIHNEEWEALLLVEPTMFSDPTLE
jgi:hypothetical protein